MKMNFRNVNRNLKIAINIILDLKNYKKSNEFSRVWINKIIIIKMIEILEKKKQIKYLLDRAELQTEQIM